MQNSRRPKSVLAAAAVFAACIGTSSPAGAEGLDLFLAELEPGRFYFGGSLGSLTGGGSVEPSTAYVSGSFPTTGFSAGALAGFDWYWGDILFGIEGDLNLALAGGGGSGTGGSTTTYNYGTDLYAHGSLRKRLGLVFGPWTVFATGGIAFSHNTFWSEACSVGTCVGLDDQSVLLFGLTGGGGVQYALNDNVSLRADLRFVAMKPSEVQLGGVGNTVLLGQSFVIASVGALVHFD